MGDRDELNKRYAYHEMSNKVEQADRSLFRRRNREPTGEVESLRGRNVGKMGDRIGRTEKTEFTSKIERIRQKRQKREHPSSGAVTAVGGENRLGNDLEASAGGQSILDLGDVTGYQPTTDQARAAYEGLLTMIGSRSLLGDQSTSLLRDAAQSVIEALKDQDLRDPERHETISQLLTLKAANSPGGISSDRFAQLVRLGKDMADYDDNQQHQPAAKEGDPVDDEMGVAVVFDEDEDDEEGGNKGADGESDIEEDVVVDSLSSEDEDDGEVEVASQRADSGEEDLDDDVVVQGAPEDAKKKTSHTHDRLLSVHEIDAHFLQRQLSRYYDDADEAADMAKQVLGVLDIKNKTDFRECENKLLILLGFDLFDTIKLLLHNRVRVWACVSMKRAQTEDVRNQVEEALSKEATGEGKQVWEEMHSRGRAEDWTRERLRGITDTLKKDDAEKDVSKALDSIGVKVRSGDGDANGETYGMDVAHDEPLELDLDALVFQDNVHAMVNKKCILPDKSWRVMKNGYEEVHVPAVKSVIPVGEELLPIRDLPSWCQSAFPGVDNLNRIQSKMYEVTLKKSDNILLCAPTGAGKTNVACLTMLNVLGQYRKGESEKEQEDTGDEEKKEDFDLESFKIVYVAPMKALVQEVVKNFTERLSPYGVTVAELSGDSSLTRQQIAGTQLIVTTPEKFDITLRQGEGRAFTQLVKLVIIDEIHLLADDRGPVLESLVARLIRQVETAAEPMRLVGLSATLPNYADVATFLRVKPEEGLFFFDGSYRPVPLQMQYLGITERNAFKRFHLQNEICYEKALAQRHSGNQVLIFVHSRAETGKTAKALRDLALDRDELPHFVRDGAGSHEILRDEVSGVTDTDLQDVLTYGFGIHHAGMNREDRELVEDLFASRHIAVLCCTATLAWGVNLPAHAVIIRGTQIYDPSKGQWTELSPLDVLQMLGRAGRPQYDSEGEGIILTRHKELQYYLSLTNLQLPVESQLIKSLPDHLNAEIVLGTIQTIAEAVEWLSYTFLYVRMLRNPSLYGIVNAEQTLREDPTLKRHRTDLAHTAASMLEKSHLLRYDRKVGSLQATPLGRVASQFYISHSSMAVYTRHMRPNMSDIELLRLFSMSEEFSHITVREEEKLELSKLAGKVPIPVKESPSEPLAKINILLQAYISRLRLDGFALMADMAFIQQSGVRIMRALFDIALKRKWASLARLCLNFANMIAYKIWRSQSPLRQFKNVPEVVARKLERKSDLEWYRYADLTPPDIGELVGVPKMGRVLHKLVHQFPRLELSAQVQPITRSMLRVELTLTPFFQFDVSVHGYVQLFHVVVEDVNCEVILHHEIFSLKSKGSEEEHVLVFSVPILEPLPPAYFVRVISDRWIHSEAILPLSFSNMILPAKFSPPTELLDLQPLLPRALGDDTLSKLFPFKEFNPIQTQTFHELFKTDRNCLVCAPSGSGKTVCAEFAILRMLTTNPNGTCVYVAPTEAIADPVFEDLESRLGTVLRKGKITRLTGQTIPDLKLLSEAKVAICSVKTWDMLSRRWRQRKVVQVSLLIFDDLHFLGGEHGPTMEIVISRMRYISGQRQQADPGDCLRIVGLSASLANARDVGDWMGVPSKGLFNFSPKVRPLPLEIHFQSFEQNNYSGRLMAMGKPVYDSIDRHIDGKNSIVYVPSRRQAQLTSIDILTYRESRVGESLLGNGVSQKEISLVAATVHEPSLQQVLSSGIGFLFDGMVEYDWTTVIDLFQKGVLRVLVCPVDLCWKTPCVAHLVVIMGTECFDGRENRHVDYPIVDLLHMMGRHETDSSGKCVLMCHAPKKDYLKKLLYDPLPVESHLDSYLHDHFNSEIVTKSIETMQDAVDYLTWTFLYRRLPKNPTYYGLRGTSNVYISEHLSEMVETVLGDLEESKCCKLTGEGDVSPLNLGMIASYYYVQYRTIELIESSVTQKTKIRGILEILSAAWEFSTLPLRYGEEKSLRIMARTLVHKLPDDAAYDSNTKALILLQIHFSRKALSANLRADQKIVLAESINLIQAIVDVISSIGWLKPALAAMELSQMVVQGLWNRDNVLKQIPHFSEEIVKRCLAYDGEEPIESVLDILTLDDGVRNDLLRLPDDKMADVAVFCNSFPSVDISFDVKDPDDVATGDPVQVVVNLERDIDEEMSEDDFGDLGKVSAALFPGQKKESWWVLIGDTKTNSILSLKRVNLRHKQSVALEFIAPEEAGDYDLTLFCMNDSYMGADQELNVPLTVARADNDDDSSDEKYE